jgi:hypothetical protein
MAGQPLSGAAHLEGNRDDAWPRANFAAHRWIGATPDQTIRANRFSNLMPLAKVAVPDCAVKTKVAMIPRCEWRCSTTMSGEVLTMGQPSTCVPSLRAPPSSSSSRQPMVRKRRKGSGAPSKQARAQPSASDAEEVVTTAACCHLSGPPAAAASAGSGVVVLARTGIRVGGNSGLTPRLVANGHLVIVPLGEGASDEAA